MGWEYHTEIFDFSGGPYSTGGLFNTEQFTFAMNRLGWEQWELVNVFDTNRVRGSTKHVVAVFKRPMTTERREEIARELGTEQA